MEQLRSRIGEGAIFDAVDFGAFRIEQYEAPEIIAAVANGIRQHGYAFAAWAELHDADLDMLALFSEHYIAHFESLDAFGRSLVGDKGGRLAALGPLASFVAIDYTALAESQLREADCIALPAPQGGFYLFRGPDGDTPALDIS